MEDEPKEWWSKFDQLYYKEAAIAVFEGLFALSPDIIEDNEESHFIDYAIKTMGMATTKDFDQHFNDGLAQGYSIQTQVMMVKQLFKDLSNLKTNKVSIH